MADIALVSLALDSSAVVAGEKQATRALHLVETAMQRTEKQSAQLNTGLNANIKKSGDSFKSLGESASRAGSSLASLGGPIGRAAGEITNLGGQIDEIVGSFGLLGGTAIAAVAGVAALGGALLTLALDGIRVSDNLADMGQSLGFSAEQMEKLNAAARLAGEDVAVVERAFSTFQGTIQSALADPTSQAAQSLRVLGVNAKAASRDTQTAFLDMLAALSGVTSSFEQLTAARDLFGRGTHSLIRTSEEFNRVLGLTNEQMVQFGFAASEAANKGAAEADKAINSVSLKFETFKRELASNWGPAIARSLEIINAGLSQMGRSGGVEGFMLGAIHERFDKLTHPQLAPLFNIGKAQPGGGGLGAPLPPPPPKPKAGRAAREVREITEFTPEQIGDPFKRGLESAQKEADATAAAIEAATMKQRIITGEWLEFLRILSSGVEKPVVGAAPPIQQVLPLQPIGPPATAIRTEEQARLDAQFALIFDDFMVTLLTAQDTLGGAFKGLALGLADTFAIELTKAMRESFINFLVPALTELLQEGISSAIGGLKGFGGGGVKGVFGGILKGIGTIFGGLFATGGTLAPGKFGIAGERGPELLFSGNQPLHIAPVSNVGGSGVISVNMNFAIAAPTGEVSQRTQDQIADSAMRGMERAQRLRGAR